MVADGGRREKLDNSRWLCKVAITGEDKRRRCVVSRVDSRGCMRRNRFIGGIPCVTQNTDHQGNGSSCCAMHVYEKKKDPGGICTEP